MIHNINTVSGSAQRKESEGAMTTAKNIVYIINRYLMMKPRKVKVIPAYIRTSSRRHSSFSETSLACLILRHFKRNNILKIAYLYLTLNHEVL